MKAHGRPYCMQTRRTNTTEKLTSNTYVRIDKLLEKRTINHTPKQGSEHFSPAEQNTLPFDRTWVRDWERLFGLLFSTHQPSRPASQQQQRNFYYTRPGLQDRALLDGGFFVAYTQHTCLGVRIHKQLAKRLTRNGGGWLSMSGWSTYEPDQSIVSCYVIVT